MIERRNFIHSIVCGVAGLLIPNLVRGEDHPKERDPNRPIRIPCQYDPSTGTIWENGDAYILPMKDLKIGDVIRFEYYREEYREKEVEECIWVVFSTPWKLENGTRYGVCAMTLQQWKEEIVKPHEERHINWSTGLHAPDSRRYSVQPEFRFPETLNG